MMVTYYVSLLLKMFKPPVITHYGYACESIAIIRTEWASWWLHCILQYKNKRGWQGVRFYKIDVVVAVDHLFPKEICMHPVETNDYVISYE